MERLVSWDELNVKVSGERIRQFALDAVKQRRAPVHDLKLVFREGALFITGRVVKVIPIPFEVAVRRIEIRGSTIRVPFEQAAAFGFLPLPKLLLSLVGAREVSDGVTVHPESLSVSIRLDRFLPPFVDLTIERIDIVEGGLRVRCSAGGADIPSGAVNALD